MIRVPSSPAARQAARQAARAEKRRSNTRTDGASGVILVNVLGVTALASAVLLVMVTLQERSVSQAQRYADLTQAVALSRGGEASAIAALRRDMKKGSREDHRAEEWAAIEEENRAIPDGDFSLALDDAQGKFNLNSMQTGGVRAEEVLRAILTRLELAPDLADILAAEIRQNGPLARLGALSALGLGAYEIETLSRMVTVLPARTTVNVNAASQELLAVLLGNPVAAERLVRRRQSQGFVTRDDLREIGSVMPPGTGFRSDFFRVRTAVSLGRAHYVAETLLRRVRDVGVTDVIVIERRRL